VFGILFGQMDAAPALIFFGVLVTLASNSMSFLYHSYQTELFPTRIRTRAVGFVYSWSRLSNVFSAFVIAFILGEFGAPGVFAFIAACMAIAASAIALLGPATSNRALEAISR
jgi:putative MFS transporter